MLVASNMTKIMEQFYKASQGILTFTVEVIGSILRTLEVAEKTNFRKKKAKFPVKKRF